MKRYLILENNMVFEGEAFGADKDSVAEIVFTTAMTGYVETLTDPSYTGQAVVQTFPLMGNYGVMSEDFEGNKISVSAYIVREYCENPSNFRLEKSIDEFLKEQGVPGIYGIDTRALTKILREHGTMNGMITSSPDKADMKEIKKYNASEPVGLVSAKETEHYEMKNGYKVVLFDFGVKKNIIRCLQKKGCDVYAAPYNTTADEVMAMSPDGIFLSNGPGDPVENTEVIKTIKQLMNKKIPTMGICLGHQLLALANGFSTTKLKYGHRGANHSAKNTVTGKIYITSQNHGYAVMSESIDENVAKEWFYNVNDRTNEGIIYNNSPCISVQFHPEACGGPHDTEFLFDEFIKLMGGNKNAEN